MPITIQRFDQRRFAPEKMQKLNLFETPRFFFDVYCLLPGQAQKAHRHPDSDKVYAVAEGEVHVQIGDQSALVRAGEAVLAPAGLDHGVVNPGPGNAALLVFMAPRP